MIAEAGVQWENTQRRQGKLVTMGVFYIGMLGQQLRRRRATC